MSILSGPRIIEMVGAKGVPRIEVDPWVPEHVQSNSLDLRLGPTLLEYTEPGPLDPRKKNRTRSYPIPEKGFIFLPSRLYLGHTVERVGVHGLVPRLDGRSTVARLGVTVHLSAGSGEDGAALEWTLEITVQRPVRLYAGMRICQVLFHTLEGERKPYAGKYQDSVGPVASRAHLDEG